jgi:hypothetical protein
LESNRIMLLISRKTCNNRKCLCHCVLNFTQHCINYWCSWKKQRYGQRLWTVN